MGERGSHLGWLPVVVLLVSEELLDEEAPVLEVDAGDEPVVAAPDIEDHPVRADPARSCERSLDLSEVTEERAPHDGLPRFKGGLSVRILLRCTFEGRSCDDVHPIA